MYEIGQSKAPQASTSYPCHEETRPFPQMAPSPPPSARPNSTSPFHSRDPSCERDASSNFVERESIESSSAGVSGVHPGEGGIFNFSPSEGGPVRLTNLTPISPTNEDVYSSAELRSNPQPPISNSFLQVLSPSRGYPYLFTGHGPPLFSTMQENEKYKKLMLKKQKRESKKEKNVLNVFKAEDIEGHKGEEDLDSVLQSMGEKVEEKKVKVKKPREKIEKSKGEKRERSRRSVEKELEDQDDEEESVEDVEKQEEENLKPVNNIRNKFVDDDLVAFKNNFCLVTPEPGPLARHKSRDCLAGSAESLPGLNTSPNMSFTKVTSKKHRTKRTKDETGKPPPGPPAPDGRRAGYALRSRDTPSVSMSREQTSSPTESIISQGEQNIAAKQSVERETQQPGLESQNFPKLVKDDFPALPGGGESQAPVLASAWNRGVAKSSDNIVTIENSVTKDEEEVFVDVTGSSKVENKEDSKANEASDVEAVIDCDVPSDSTDQNGQVNDINDFVDESEEKDNSDVEEETETITKTDIYADLTNFPNEGEVDLDKDDVSVIDNFEVVTSEDEFNRRKADNSAAVVIFSEADQDWGSAEFTFGFDVNEDLVANTNTVPVVETSQHPQQMWAMPGSMGQLTPIDTVDGAILSFGGPDPMRMIVPVAVGVPVPVNNLGELGEHLPPLPFYPHHQFPNGAVIPPFGTYGLPYGHQLPPQGVHPVHHYHGEEQELDTEKDVEDNTGEDQTISPESGISSASPLSWQPDSSPSLPAPGSYPHPRDTGRDIPAPLPLVSQVSQSLSNWQGHSVHDSSDSDRSSPAPGWATQVEFEEFRVAEGEDAIKESSDKTNDSGLASENSLLEKDLKDSKLEKFNLGEIVNFISSSWSSVSQDSSVSVFSAGSHSRTHTNVVA
eukprot:TRINITY_DN11182_c0_g1_i1.p1 TRINITY_DN11182_c0_g1~~TRINITY_DN11182_c0_g1_i1.p1  ORF type:complete len:899 (+),score=293.78 TRINITY_DN11182_c0_g1_i1:966-3662(+)